MPCKEPVRTRENTPMLYRPCTASFAMGSRKTGRLSILRTSRRDVLEPYWEDEAGSARSNSCLLMTQKLRLFAADIIGYLCGYAHLINKRLLVLPGDPDASAYELLFAFSAPTEK